MATVQSDSLPSELKRPSGNRANRYSRKCTIKTENYSRLPEQTQTQLWYSTTGQWTVSLCTYLSPEDFQSPLHIDCVCRISCLFVCSTVCLSVRLSVSQSIGLFVYLVVVTQRFVKCQIPFPEVTMKCVYTVLQFYCSLLILLLLFVL